MNFFNKNASLVLTKVHAYGEVFFLRRSISSNRLIYCSISFRYSHFQLDLISCHRPKKCIHKMRASSLHIFLDFLHLTKDSFCVRGYVLTLFMIYKSMAHTSAKFVQESSYFHHQSYLQVVSLCF